MTQHAANRNVRTRPPLIDCDIHPKMRSTEDLRPYLTDRWWHYLQTYGARRRHGYVKGHVYPKTQPGDGARRDAWPPAGGPPGSDLAFMQKQYLDPAGVAVGIMTPLGPGQGDQNVDLSAAICAALNQWQIEQWASADPRLKASVVVPYEDAERSRQEIHTRADDKRFAQVMLLSRTSEALGRRRYWPIYEAAVEHGLPVGIHVFGDSGWPVTGSGWPSFYIEEMTAHEAACAALLTSMIAEGAFERFPELKIILIEAGFAWMPPLTWRLDKLWERFRDEIDHVAKPPSEYVRDHIWVTTQPMEEPDPARPKHLADVVDWFGRDRILFASDYPHWDFDDPVRAIPATLGEECRDAIYFGNAQKLFGF